MVSITLSLTTAVPYARTTACALQEETTWLEYFVRALKPYEHYLPIWKDGPDDVLKVRLGASCIAAVASAWGQSCVRPKYYNSGTTADEVPKTSVLALGSPMATHDRCPVSSGCGLCARGRCITCLQHPESHMPGKGAHASAVELWY